MSRPAEEAGSAFVLRNYVAGEWREPGALLPHTVRDANTGEPLFRQMGSTPAQVNRAIRSADAAHRGGVWRNMRSERRAEVLTGITIALEAIVEVIAHTDALMTGVPITRTRSIARVCPAAFRSAAKLALEDPAIRREAGFIVERLPLGPAAVAAPWNAPSGIACHKLASALAAGCPVVFKPSEWAPISGQLIAEAIAGSGLPEGMFQLLHGDGETCAAIVDDERIAAVSLTGGIEAGRSVAATCARQVKPAQLELGGNNPLLALRGADIGETADGVVTALTTLNGQWCRALGRLIVHESLADELVEATMDRLSTLRAGSSTDSGTEFGPLAHRAHRTRVEAAIGDYRAQGGTIHQNTPLPPLAGWFVPPTLVTGVDPERTLEEVFGPVATVHAFAAIDEGVALANQAPYGLAAYVFGERGEAFRAARRIEAGMVRVNSVTLFSPHPSAPRPAWKLSGIGDEGSRETFEFFRGTRVIGMPRGLPEQGRGDASSSR